MANRAVRRGTPRSVRPRGAYGRVIRPRYVSISQLERERQRRDEFYKGSMWAAAAFCALFAFLSFGVVMWGW